MIKSTLPSTFNSVMLRIPDEWWYYDRNKSYAYVIAYIDILCGNLYLVPQNLFTSELYLTRDDGIDEEILTESFKRFINTYNSNQYYLIPFDEFVAMPEVTSVIQILD